MTEADQRAMCGTLIGGRYLVEEPIGAGGFAWVFRGSTPTKSRVAIKVLHSTDQVAYSRFQREVKVLKSLPRTPHTVEHIDDGRTADGRPFLVMSYVEGKTLAQEMDGWNRLEPRDAAAFLSELCEAFIELHRLGVVHRDVKPENIILTKTGDITLIDLGIVRDAQGILKLLEQDEELERRIFQDEIDRWTIAGTPEYMAPEQFSDGMAADLAAARTDTWSDVFSLGVILHELIGGAVPFPLKAPLDRSDLKKTILQYMLWRTRLTDDDVPGCHGIDPALDSIRRKALRSNPRQRQPDAQALRLELKRYLETGRGVRRSYDTFTQAMTAEEIARLESQRLQMRAAIKAMESALEGAGTSPRDESLAELEEEPEDADEDMLAKPGTAEEADDDEVTIARPRVATSPEGEEPDGEEVGEQSADQELEGAGEGALDAPEDFVIIDLPPRRKTRPPPAPTRPAAAEEEGAKEPAGMSVFRRTFVFDEEDLSLLDAPPAIEGDPAEPAAPKGSKRKTRKPPPRR